MTREIKFRGKTNNGNWLVGEIISLNNHKYIAPNDGDWFDFIKWVPENVFHAPDSDKYEVEENTIGQYTGLHAKNGKEIYEGDIIAANGRQIGYIVGGVRGYCYDVIYTPAKSNGEKAWPLYSVVTRDYPNKCEVIGNIYDNPELLKED